MNDNEKNNINKDKKEKELSKDNSKELSQDVEDVRKSRLSHNSYFCSVVLQKRIITKFLKSSLPDYLANIIDFDSMESSSETYTKDDLRMLYSDAVLKFKLKKNSCNITVGMIIEHKANLDKNDILQLFDYVISEMRKNSKEKGESLRPVTCLIN